MHPFFLSLHVGTSFVHSLILLFFIFLKSLIKRCVYRITNLSHLLEFPPLGTSFVHSPNIWGLFGQRIRLEFSAYMYNKDRFRGLKSGRRKIFRKLIRNRLKNSEYWPRTLVWSSVTRTSPSSPILAINCYLPLLFCQIYNLHIFPHILFPFLASLCISVLTIIIINNLTV